jgi:hypothetical protein
MKSFVTFGRARTRYCLGTILAISSVKRGSGAETQWLIASRLGPALLAPLHEDGHRVEFAKRRFNKKCALLELSKKWVMATSAEVVH